MTLPEIKLKISKILIKWNMPTRQVAINEIVSLYSEALEAQEKRIEKIIKKTRPIFLRKSDILSLDSILAIRLQLRKEIIKDLSKLKEV
jgi:hypothetical protein